MTVEERAVMGWSALVLAAHHGRLVHYHAIADAIAYSRAGIAHVLERIQSYCILNELPPLTSIVVTNEGRPSNGYITLQSVPQDQFQTLAFDWLNNRPMPTADDFRRVHELIGDSCGADRERFLARADEVRPEYMASRNSD